MKRSRPTRLWAVVGTAGVLFATPALSAPSTAPAPSVVSTGAETTLLKHLEPEKPTVFVFVKPSSTLERSFLEQLRKGAGDRVGIRAVHLTSGTEPIAKQYDVKETPFALVFDRRGRFVSRSADAAEIRTAVQKAAGVMRIDWAEEGDPRLDEARKLLGGRPQVPGILRTMSLKPEYMAHINSLSGIAHFSDGFLPRRTKELIATYVSALNKCKY